jgi:hypothetical protein
VLHERAIAAIDVELIGGVPVTTLLRTLTDLVLAAGDDPRTAEWMRRLAAAASDLVPTVRQAIESRTRMPGKRAALARIVELERYEDVTR